MADGSIRSAIRNTPSVSSWSLVSSRPRSSSENSQRGGSSPVAFSRRVSWTRVGRKVGPIASITSIARSTTSAACSGWRPAHRSCTEPRASTSPLTSPMVDPFQSTMASQVKYARTSCSPPAMTASQAAPSSSRVIESMSRQSTP
jgi:hypothetical protein